MAESTRGASQRKDKRAAPRRRSRVQVRFWNDEFEACAFTTDVSDTGLLIESARRLEPGTRLHIELEVGTRSYLSEVVVARRQDYPVYAQSFFKPALGLRFLGLAEVLEDTPPERGAEPPAALESAPAAGTSPADKPSYAVNLSDPARLRALFERDLSKGGLLVRTARPPALGTALCVALQLPPPHGTWVVHGEVVSAVPGSGQVGLLLHDSRPLSARLRALLDSGL